MKDSKCQFTYAVKKYDLECRTISLFYFLLYIMQINFRGCKFEPLILGQKNNNYTKSA